MDPITALAIGSAAFSAIGAIQQGNAAAASEQSQANAMRYQAETNRQRAVLALQQGNQQEEAKRRENRRAMGNLRAGLVENGIGLEGGTGADLVAESSLNSELDALNIRYNAQLNAQGLQQQAVSDDYSASAAMARSKNARTAGLIGAGAAVLTGAGQVYQGYQNKRIYDAQMKYYGG